MIRTPLPTLDPNYVYSIRPLEDAEEYSLCIYPKHEAIYYDDNAPLAYVVLAEYPSDFEMVIRQAVVGEDQGMRGVAFLLGVLLGDCCIESL